MPEPAVDPSSSKQRQPMVSIILPTYNRAEFLPAAFEAIRAQTFTDWELIVIDDGSTDDTRSAVAALAGCCTQSVSYHYQQNKGAFGARNAGLDLARGQFIAFYDSDDLWLAHHLLNCVTALDNCQDLDWVYGACRKVDQATGVVLAQNTFYENSRPRPFLKLRSRSSGQLRIIDDPLAAKCMILHGLMCGLQTSVFRSRVFANLRLPPYRIGEDQIFAVTAILSGFKLGYFDSVHVIYRVHSANVSGAANGGGLDRQIWVVREESRGYEELLHSKRLTPFRAACSAPAVAPPVLLEARICTPLAKWST